VTTSYEVGLAGHDDTDHLPYAYREGRVLLTHDKEFLDNQKHPPYRSPGIAVSDIELEGAEIATMLDKMVLFG